MRLEKEKADFLKNRIRAIDPDSEIYLFGSRTDNTQKGGDIDVLILTKKHLPRPTLRNVKMAFYQKFGYQRLDLVNFLFREDHPLKQLALLEAEQL